MLGTGLSIPTIATLSKGVPYRITIGGVVYERVTDDVTGALLIDDASGQPLYAQVFA